MTFGPGRRRAVSLSLLVAVGIAAGTVYTVSAVFSPRCAPATPCVSLRALLSGAPLPEAIHVLDREGESIADVAGPLRWTLKGEEIPSLVSESFVAVEDRRFWDHEGVDARGVARAFVRNLRAGQIEEGASTIPMQLVRTLWGESLRDVGPWRRKVIEARTAPLLVRRLGHEGVLALYLNAIYLGNGVYGVEAASRYYFGVSADSLTLAQVATLVGMTRSPEFYEPRRHPRRALERRNVVLDLLADEGVASRADVSRVREQPLETAPQPAIRDGRTHLTAAVTRELRTVAPGLAGMPGLRVYTTIDARVQAAGVAALDAQLRAIESGSLGRFQGNASDALEGAVVALDPGSGAVRAWVGGRDFQHSEFDRVSQARRQVGSLIKPFIVAAGMELQIGILDLVSTLGPEPGDLAGPAPWAPDDHVNEPVLPVREALIRSSNRAAVNLGTVMGVDWVRAVGRDAGIESPIPDVPSSFIGAFEASLLEMTAAYATLGNGGVRVPPFLIQRVAAGDGEVLWTRPEHGPVHALDPTTSYVILDALRAVVDRGTAASVRTAGFRGPAAGKTGTTNDGRDAWFIGLVPDLAAGVWIGFDRPGRIVAGGSGGSLAAPTWARWMMQVQDPSGTTDWAVPSGVHQVRYDPVSGEIARSDCREGPAASFPLAYVRDARYASGGCAGLLGHWLKSLWRTLVPAPSPTVIRPKWPGGQDDQ